MSEVVEFDYIKRMLQKVSEMNLDSFFIVGRRKEDGEIALAYYGNEYEMVALAEIMKEHGLNIIKYGGE